MPGIFVRLQRVLATLLSSTEVLKGMKDLVPNEDCTFEQDTILDHIITPDLNTFSGMAHSFTNAIVPRIEGTLRN